MKPYYRIIAILIVCAFSKKNFAQTPDTSAIHNLSAQFSHVVLKRSAQLNDHLDKKTEKALRRYTGYQNAILKRLSKVDSTAARNFSIVSDQKYKELQARLSMPGSLKRYIPSLDTLNSSLNFLKRYAGTEKKVEAVNRAVSSVKKLTEQMKRGEDVKEYLNEEKLYIKDQLERFGLAKELKKVNKNIYYYSEELVELKSTLQDEKKIERKVISLLSQNQSFQQFIQRNGMLAGLLGSTNQATDMGASTLTGLQTRSDFSQLIQNQIAAGGANAQNVMQENLQMGQQQLQQLKNKLMESGNRGSEDIMPEGFRPNNQHARSFLKRLELNTNIQSQRAGSYFPVSTDLGLGVGYRLSDAAIVGIGASYRVGWGQSISHISISHQGIGIRSYLDWKLSIGVLKFKGEKGTWWITGGYEQNYKAEIKKIEALKNYSAWQASGLLGISKIVPFNTQLFKGTKLQLLWDFLSYRQVPRVSPLVFRVGYSIK